MEEGEGEEIYFSKTFVQLGHFVVKLGKTPLKTFFCYSAASDQDNHQLDPFHLDSPPLSTAKDLGHICYSWHPLGL